MIRHGETEERAVPLIAMLAAQALAADPLIQIGPADAALRQMAQGSGRPAESFTPVSWSELVREPVRVVGEGQFIPCAGPPSTVSQWRLAVDGADGALGYGDLGKAREELAVADAMAACLSQDPDPAAIARWYRVRGALGDGPSLALAQALEPGAPWNPAWPTDQKTSYEAAKADPVDVTVVAWGEPIHVDGKPADARIVPGTHLLRSRDGDVRGLLQVPDEPFTVLFPQLYPEDGPGDLGDPQVREWVTALLAAEFQPGARVFVADSTSAWGATAGRTDWVALRSVKRSPLIPIGAVIGGVGAGAGLLGGVLALGAVGGAEDAAAGMSAATTPGQFDTSKAEYDAKASQIRVMRGVAVGGAALLAIGGGVLVAGVARGEVKVQTLAVHGGAGLQLVVRR